MYGARTTNRYSSNFLNERENFFHKPLVNLNHFLTINDAVRLSSVLYWSGGSGGGTGTYGSVSRKPAIEGNQWWASSPWTWDWDAEIAAMERKIAAESNELRAKLDALEASKTQQLSALKMRNTFNRFKNQASLKAAEKQLAVAEMERRQAEEVAALADEQRKSQEKAALLERERIER